MQKYLKRVNEFFSQTDFKAYELQANAIAILGGIILSFKIEYFQDVLRGHMEIHVIHTVLLGIVNGLCTFYLSGAFSLYKFKCIWGVWKH